jgi:hypothetical protein
MYLIASKFSGDAKRVSPMVLAARRLMTGLVSFERINLDDVLGFVFVFKSPLGQKDSLYCSVDLL